MIIDLILDRKDGLPYEPGQFYRSVMGYGEVGKGISAAMDEGTEEDVKAQLSLYVIENGYNDEIIFYIRSVDWL